MFFIIERYLNLTAGIIDYFNNATESLIMFKNDPLVYEPGTQYLYSNLGFDLISAIIESVLGINFETAIINVIYNELGMTTTFLERPENLYPNRSKYYAKLSANKIINTPIHDEVFICVLKGATILA